MPCARELGNFEKINRHTIIFIIIIMEQEMPMGISFFHIRDLYRYIRERAPPPGI
jgi:hypothetical protein